MLKSVDELIPGFFNKRICQLTSEDNFQSWKHVLLVVCGLNLVGHLFGTLLVPYVIDDTDGNKIVNLQYSKFSQQDSSLVSYLLASILSPINKGLAGCMIVASIWTKLHQKISSSSTTCIMSLYGRLKVHKLLHKSMRDYLIEIQLTCDSLASCGGPVKEMQQITIILNGV